MVVWGVWGRNLLWLESVSGVMGPKKTRAASCITVQECMLCWGTQISLILSLLEMCRVCAMLVCAF
jgi:hypothetical protein